MIKILLADDHTIFREGLKQIFEDTPDLEVNGEASSPHEALNILNRTDCDLVLLDISFPGRSGLDILKQIKTIKPKLPVLILSMHPEEDYGVRSLRAGANGYLTKASEMDELIKAIREVARGKRYITPSLADKLALELSESGIKLPHQRLTDREFQVMCLIASGKRIKDIASLLSLSVKTVDTYRSRILEKMNKKNIAELIHYAIKNDLLD